jgi:hypothetical protein
MKSCINQFTFNKDELLSLSDSTVKKIIVHLEEGHVIYLSNMAFSLSHHESFLLTPGLVSKKSKNISYHAPTNQLRGCDKLSLRQKMLLSFFMERYCQYATNLIKTLLPQYTAALEIGRTSYRPVEVNGRRIISYRKDDSRLHVDAFPSTPVQGRRILRVFSNINPLGHPRVWNVGESFQTVVDKFLPILAKQKPFAATVLNALGITRGLRTPYDHYMLDLHDRMKADLNYQQEVQKETIAFPAGSTWIVFTDKTSHAALSGQYLLEQTFYLPVHAMNDEQTSPLRILESKLQCELL